MSDFSDLFKDTIVVTLDGGLGTSLGDVFHKNISDTPLWSAKLIEEDPETVIQAHLSFLRSGATVILTSTYQASFRTFERAGFSQNEAEAIMRKSVTLANEARTRFLNEQSEESTLTQSDIRIALSLGPFGASLSGAHEFDGIYPPPYGPTSPKGHLTAFESGAHELIGKSVDALASFHLERLRVFAGDAEAWKNVDCLAFETVPLAREVTAIRKAVGALRAGGGDPKPWWVSLIFPNGQFLETDGPGGSPLSLREIITVISRSDREDQGQDELPVPNGLGINCTDIGFLHKLGKELGDSVAELWGDNRKPWLVIYPNGGLIYNPVSRVWNGRNFEKGVWADKLSNIVMKTLTLDYRKPWGGIIAGGCCQTTSEDILVLSKGLKSIRDKLEAVAS